jgi:predicted ATPase
VASPAAGGRALLGRERELSELRGALTDAAAGRGSLIVVTGVAGIGKSLLVETACREAEAAGVRVGRGAGWEAGGAPPYWPWIEALTSLDGASAALLEGESEPGGALGVQARSRTTEESGSARFARFGQLRERMAQLAARRPLLVTLEHLQTADAPSLRL